MITITNLITDRWIPVRRKNGEHEEIAPWQITDGDESGNPVMAVTALRPDFDGALVQFIIGLCQTAIPPEDYEEWREMLLHPPGPDELRAKLEPIQPAFNLDGNGPRFMQDPGAADRDYWSIENLIIGMPEKTKISENTDWFVKRGTVHGLCPKCAAMALFTLQTNAPSGGRGHMTSLRGGGPMTCIILGQTLWQTVWVNVIDQESRDCDGTPATAGDSRRFPWMGTLRTSEGDRKTTPRDAHPDQAFWATPRRILLDFENALPGRCDLCGEETDHLVTQFQTKPYGVSYVGWVHPLSPYYRKDRSSTDLLPSHLQADGITYQNWLGTVINDRSKGVWVSQNVALFPGRTPPGKIRAIYSGYGGRPRLWVFGYDMDNKKPRCYYEGTMPIITAEGEWAASFEEVAAGMVRAAGESAKNTQWCVKVALYDNPSDIQGGFSVIPASFYQATEEIFFQNLEEVASLLSGGKDLSGIRRMWLETLRDVSTQLFDEYSQIDSIDAINAQRAVNARRLLLNPYSKSNRAIREHLGIPDPQKKAKNSV